MVMSGGLETSVLHEATMCFIYMGADDFKIIKRCLENVFIALVAIPAAQISDDQLKLLYRFLVDQIGIKSNRILYGKMPEGKTPQEQLHVLVNRPKAKELEESLKDFCHLLEQVEDNRRFWKINPEEIKDAYREFHSDLSTWKLEEKFQISNLRVKCLQAFSEAMLNVTGRKKINMLAAI